MTNDYDRLVAEGKITPHVLYLTSDQQFPASIADDVRDYARRCGARSVDLLWADDDQQTTFQITAHKYEFGDAVAGCRRLVDQL